MEVRLATPDDASPLAAIHVRTWQTAYRGLIPDETLDSLDVAERAARWRSIIGDCRKDTFVAINDDGIVGFCSVEPSRNEAEARQGVGELTSLYVDPDYWRKGAGRALCDAAIAQAQDRRFRELILWVLELNHAARSFYESMGFELDSDAEYTRESGGGTELAHVRYWIDLSPSAA